MLKVGELIQVSDPYFDGEYSQVSLDTYMVLRDFDWDTTKEEFFKEKPELIYGVRCGEEGYVPRKLRDEKAFLTFLLQKEYIGKPSFVASFRINDNYPYERYWEDRTDDLFSNKKRNDSAVDALTDPEKNMSRNAQLFYSSDLEELRRRLYRGEDHVEN
jgi:hypothetical protein